MAYGPFNAGGGGSSYDIEALTAQIISGKVTAQLATTDGETICTTDGIEINAVKYL